MDYVAALADGVAATAAQMEYDKLQKAALEISKIDWDRLNQ